MPMVIFAAKQVVDEENGDGGAGDDHEEIAEEEKAKHVVELAEPDRSHDEVELDKDRAEGQETDYKHGGDRFQVWRRWWDLAGDLVGPHRWTDGALLEGDPRARERKWYGY